MSEKEITKKYNKLLESVKNDDFYKIDLTNRVNTYICPNQHVTKTRDVDAGVTPFMEKCETCGEYASSTMYRDFAPKQEPTMEWYRPSLEETLKLKNNLGMLEHVLEGGLMLRNIAE